VKTAVDIIQWVRAITAYGLY